MITPLIPKGQTGGARTGLADQVENSLPLLPHFLKGIQQLSRSGRELGGGGGVENWKTEGAVSLTTPF